MKRLCILALIHAQLNFGAASSSACSSDQNMIQLNETAPQGLGKSRRPRMLQSSPSGAASSSFSVESPGQQSSNSPHLNPDAYREYLELKEGYKALCSSLAPTKKDATNNRSVADWRADPEITGLRTLLRKKKTAARLESSILPGSIEFCDLKYAEHLAAQELIKEQKDYLSLEAKEKAASSTPKRLLDLSRDAAANTFWFLLPKSVHKEAAELIQTKINQTYATYAQTKRNIDPDGYNGELETAFYETANNLNMLQAEKNVLIKNIRVLRKHNLSAEAISRAQAELNEIEAACQKASHELQIKRRAFAEAEASLQHHASSSNSVLERSTPISIFSHTWIPGTLEYLQQSRIKLLGSYKLLKTIQADSEQLDEEISRSSCHNRMFPSNKSKALELLETLTNSAFQKNWHCMIEAKKRFLNPDRTKPFESDFFRQTNILQDAIAQLLHPILHGHAEPIPENTFDKILVAVQEGCSLIGQGKIQEAVESIFNILKDTVDPKATFEIASEGINLAVAFSNNAVVARTVRKSLEKVGRCISPRSQDKLAQGASSDQAMRDIKDGKKTTSFQSWHPEIECPNGIEHCPRLGWYSKMILTAIAKCIQNINIHDNKKRLPYFNDPQDVNQVLLILNNAISDIYQTNIKTALNNQSCDDRKLKNTYSIIDFLSRLPLDFYNIDEKLEQNRDKIDALLAGYTVETKRGFDSWMRELRRKAFQPDYGHTINDAGINLILVGPTAVGKTLIMTELSKLLGLSVIEMTLKDLLAVPPEGQSVQKLLQSGSLTPLEHKLSNLSKNSSSLLIMVHIDEASNDHGITDSQLKRYLCQFKKLFLPSLQIHLPTNLNLIMTCNKSSFIHTDPALAGRFIVIPFEELTPEAKIDRFYPKLVHFFTNNPLLKDICKDLDLKQIATEYVHFDTSLNMRLLESRLSCVVDYFTQKYEKKAGNWHLFSPEDRNFSQETFQEFLARIFHASSPGNTLELPLKEKIDLLLPKLIACVKNHPRYNADNPFFYNQVVSDYVEFDQNVDIESLTAKIPALVDFLFANAHPSEEDFQAFFAQLFNKNNHKLPGAQDEDALIAQSSCSSSSQERSDEQQDNALGRENDQSSSDDDSSCNISTASSSEHDLSSSSSGDSDNDHDTE